MVRGANRYATVFLLYDRKSMRKCEGYSSHLLLLRKKYESPEKTSCSTGVLKKPPFTSQKVK